VLVEALLEPQILGQCRTLRQRTNLTQDLGLVCEIRHYAAQIGDQALYRISIRLHFHLRVYLGG
jgi:hypothetical protein